MRKICVFCGSSPGSKPEYLEAAKRLGRVLVEKKIGLVYGGASVGMMGEVARTVLTGGGDVVGVIPKALKDKEVAFTDLDDLRIVDSMHERKALMAELSDGFIAMPGGLGTLDEFFEVLTWAQLGLHEKPCGLLNVCGYYDPLMLMIDKMVDEYFVNAVNRAMVHVDEMIPELIERMARYRPPELDKAEWILKLNGRTMDMA